MDHRNMESVASSATSLLIADGTQGTSIVQVASGVILAFFGVARKICARIHQQLSAPKRRVEFWTRASIFVNSLVSLASTFCYRLPPWFKLSLLFSWPSRRAMPATRSLHLLVAVFTPAQEFLLPTNYQTQNIINPTLPNHKIKLQIFFPWCRMLLSPA